MTTTMIDGDDGGGPPSTPHQGTMSPSPTSTTTGYVWQRCRCTTSITLAPNCYEDGDDGWGLGVRDAYASRAQGMFSLSLLSLYY